MRHCKPPVNDHETALAMAVRACNTNCDCSIWGPCNCSTIPMHQIQYGKANNVKTTVGVQAAAESLTE